MSVKVKTAKELLENMNKHFGNKYKVNEEDLMPEEPKKEDEVSEEDGEEEVEKEEKPISEEEGEEVEPKKDEEPVAEEDGSMNDMGELEKGVAGIIEKLISEEFGSDMESQKDAASDMMKVAESEEPVSNKFMEAMSDVTSAMELKEDADGEYLVTFHPEKWAHLSEKYCKSK